MKIEFEPACTGTNGRKIKSRYTHDGSFPKRGVEMPLITTVGEMKEFLAQIPDELPIEGPFNPGIKPIWFNIGDHDEHLQFDDG